MLRDAIRSLRKNPGLIAIAILSLSLGIGANTAIFSLLDQILLRMLPVEAPERLVQLAARGPHYGSNTGSNAMSYPMYKDFRDKAEVFDGVLCRYAVDYSLGYAGRTERIRGELVSGNYFQVLGVGAALGRTFTPDDDKTPGGHPIVMLAYDFWRSRFAGDEGIVGKRIVLNNQTMTVIGVARQGFFGVEVGEQIKVFTPLMMYERMMPLFAQFYTLENRRGRWVNVFGRLKPGVSAGQAQAAVAPLYRQIIEDEVKQAAFANTTEYTRTQFLTSRMEVFPGATGRSQFRRFLETPLYVLMALTGLVLLIACANVANLLIVRAAARQKEMAVRLALGSSKARIAGQLLMESLLLAGAATAIGVALSGVLVRALLATFTGGEQVLTIHASPEPRVLLFAAAVGLATALLFGLAPALQAGRQSVAGTLKDESGSVSGGGSHARLRKALVTAQVALSLLLLIASGLFVRTLANLRDVNPGFVTNRLYTFQVDPRANGYDADRTRLFYRDLAARLGSMPGSESSAYSIVRLLDGNEWDSTITVEGHQAAPGERMNPHFNYLSPGFFKTIHAPVTAGREFTEADVMNAPKVCVVNESFSKHYFPKGGAIGRRIGMGGNPGTKTDIEIVGIVADLKYESLRDEIPRQVFIPFGQVPYVMEVTSYTRSALSADEFFAAVRKAVSSMDPNLPVYEMRTLDQQLDRSLTTERLIASLSGAFGVLATLLAVIGLYGVMTYTVSQRSREIGIRMALGADGARIAGMVLREVALLVGIGVAVALPAYFGLARFVRSQLYGVTTGDAMVVAGAVVLLGAVALGAGYLPARRAGAMSPLRVLRYE
ncbi:MAG: ABC transporter permease [Bryobacteraceae bacterium]